MRTLKIFLLIIFAWTVALMPAQVFAETTKVILVRHGETDWNKEYRLQGRTQILLNERGREQARQTAAGLKRQGIVFDAVYASPLLRAVETAEILSGFPRERIKTDERIIEFAFGAAFDCGRNR